MYLGNSLNRIAYGGRLLGARRCMCLAIAMTVFAVRQSNGGRGRVAAEQAGRGGLSAQGRRTQRRRQRDVHGHASGNGHELIGMWTQSTVEARGDNRIMLARTADGVKWSQPVKIAGTTPGTSEPQASWGLPVGGPFGADLHVLHSGAEGTPGGPAGERPLRRAL